MHAPRPPVGALDPLALESPQPAPAPAVRGSAPAALRPPPFDALRHVLSARAPTRQRVPGMTPAAVLVGLFEGEGGHPWFWLVRRPEGLRKHPGQVALPGGKRDPADPDLMATALREAHEEIGLPPSAVEILGTDDDHITVTGYIVTPVVGWIRAPFSPRPAPEEVSRVFHAPLTLFRERGLLRALPLTLRRLVRTYEVDGEIVWGATAAILGSLARRYPWRGA